MKIETRTANAFSLLLFATFLFAGTVHAQTDDRSEPGMLPDHPMYFLTSVSESIGTFFTFGDANESQRALDLSEKRLAEAHALADQGKPEAAERAVERYRTQLDRALAEAEEARANGEDADEVLTNVSEATSRHQTVLAEVYDRVPEQARPGIERAMEASKRGHERAEKARAGSRGRPDSPGRTGPRRRGPPDSMESERPDDADRSRPRDRGRPDSAAGERPDGDERGPPRNRGRPDSVETGRPDTTGGR